MFQVQKAKRSRRPLKINLEGLSGSGKTFTMIRLAFAMMRSGIGKRFVIADSENESAGLYDGIVMDGQKWEYEVCQIPPEARNPTGYTAAYNYLVSQGYDLIGMDSLSHAWHGAMEQVDEYAAKNRGDKFGAWAKITPAQRDMLATLTDGRAHLITTMRVKSEYERYEKANGKEGIRKIGTKTDQREGAEYEFDVVARLDLGHEIVVEKVRGCTSMDGKVGMKPGPDFWQPLFSWWLSAEPVVSEDDRLSATLRAANTPEELRAAWEKLSKPQQSRLLAVKDSRKAEIQARATQAPAPLSDEESRAMAEDFFAICEAIHKSPADAIAGLWEFTGMPTIHPMPQSVGDLTDAQLAKLVEVAKQKHPDTGV